MGFTVLTALSKHAELVRCVESRRLYRRYIFSVAEFTECYASYFVQALTSLMHLPHRHIARIYSVEYTTQAVVVVAEAVGETLALHTRRALEEAVPLPPHRVRDALYQLLGVHAFLNTQVSLTPAIFRYVFFDTGCISVAGHGVVKVDIVEALFNMCRLYQGAPVVMDRLELQLPAPVSMTSDATADVASLLVSNIVRVGAVLLHAHLRSADVEPQLDRILNQPVAHDIAGLLGVPLSVMDTPASLLSKLQHSSYYISLGERLQAPLLGNTTRLMIAAGTGDLDGVREFIHQAGVTAPDGWTALMLAVAGRQTEAALLLVEAEACYKTKEGIYASRIALELGLAVILGALYEFEASLLAADGYTNYMVHASLNDLEGLKGALGGRDLDVELSATSATGNTVIQYAILGRAYSCVEYLLPYYLRQSEATRQGLLSLAISVGDAYTLYLFEPYLRFFTFADGKTLLMRYLESPRADPQVTRALASGNVGQRTVDAHTAAYYGFVTGNWAALQPLLGDLREQSSLRELGVTSLMIAILEGDRDAFKRYLPLEAGAVAANGITSLMLAAALDYDDMIAALLEREGRCFDATGHSAFMHWILNKARSRNCADPMQSRSFQLLSRVEGSITNNAGVTPLMFAAGIDEAAAIVETLSKHIYSFATDKRGRTALMYAASGGCHSSVRILGPIECGYAAHNGERALEIVERHLAEDQPYRSLNFRVIHDWLCKWETFTRDEGGNTPLHLAALGGDLVELRKHLHLRGCVNADGNTALLLALTAGHTDFLEDLIMEVGRRNGVQVYAAKVCLLRGYTTALRRLAPLEQALLQEDRVTPLMLAACYGDLEQLERHRDLLKKTTTGGVTALMLAAAHHQVEAARELLPEARIVAINMGTALMTACERKAYEVAQLLLPLEARLTDHYGLTALQRAARSGNVEAVRLLVPAEQGGLCHQPITIRSKTYQGVTALMLAAFHGHRSVARLLLAELGLQTDEGYTALMFAVLGRHRGCVKLLVDPPDLKGEIRMTTRKGRTALMLAAHKGYLDAFEHLSEEVGMRSIYGWSALVHAAACGCDEAIIWLAPHEAQANGRRALEELDKIEEQTGLRHDAARAGIVRHLLR
ncbi:Ankyrin repeat protein 1 [Giardia muris]|uniref:Ankyrin repeat protein 1 n=1 Tax=Giardia muris TaxID=5742 RepID=A0A4Z1SMZ5_GIAMU|nr:Ankyrin repeat protein 1 [Giardia muris]|eukprot:TNJ27076.1 Ankyrin repeat protein 1 [Giardia muris]